MAPPLLPLVLSTLVIAQSTPSPATGYVGADAAIRQIAAKAAVTPATDKSSGVATLLRDLASYDAQSESMPPDAAATKWLALFDRLSALRSKAAGEKMREVYQLSTREALCVLPNPKDWPALAAAIKLRKTPGKHGPLEDQTLQLLADVLTRKDAQLVKEVGVTAANLSKAMPPYAQMFAQCAATITEALAEQANDAEQISQSIMAKLNGVENNGMIYLPNLASLVGPDKAETIIVQALQRDTGQIVPPSGGRSLKLARRLAVKYATRLAAPQWGLANSIDSLKLFETRSPPRRDLSG